MRQYIRSEKRREFCLFQQEGENKFSNSEAKSPVVHVVRPSLLQNQPVQVQKRERWGSRKQFKDKDVHTHWAPKVCQGPALSSVIQL